MKQQLEKFFRLQNNATNVRTEIFAGITTFMTMAYILAVNPSILADSGMDKNAVFVATVLASALGSILMGMLANYPFALAPGMGLNAYFAYTVVLGMGYSWQFALTAVFIEGIIFIILSLTNVREAIFNAIPKTLKIAVSVGIGLFIALLGLQNAKIVVSGAFYDFSSASRSEGLTVILAMIGIIITAILLIKKVKGAILWGILATWGLGMFCELVGLYIPNPESGMYSLLPDWSNWFNVGAISSTFCKFEFKNIFNLDGFIIVISFLFVDMFDTLGTLIGVASKAEMLDKDGKLPRIKGALLSDAIATSAGAVLGTSTTTTFVESASGVGVGGRTGLTAIVTGLLFLCSLIFSPIFLAIPSFATAPALVMVGLMMLESILKIDFKDYSESAPAFICIIAMPFTASISEGISLGVISYVFINLIVNLITKIKDKNAKIKKIHWMLYILTILFILKYILL